MTDPIEKASRERAIAKAASWLASLPEDGKPHPLIPYLERAYSLSAVQAIAAIRKANEIRRAAA